MEYKKYLIIMINILCIHSNNWYLATDNSNLKIFESQINQKQDKIRRFIPLNTEDRGLIDKKNMNSTVLDYYRAEVREFKPSDYMQISTLLKSTKRSALKTDSVAHNTYISINNTIPNNNIIQINRAKRINKRRCAQRPKKNRFNSKGQNRFLDVFEVVEFDHVTCSALNGFEGTCLHEYDCQKLGGKTMGTCADGYGTCCVMQFTCDGRSSSPSVWFTNPGYPTPSPDRLSCSFTLEKYSDEVKQIRLDFKSFEILPPTAGSCEQDQFLVTGQNVNNVIPILCGINTGQHVYIEVSNAEGPIVLSFQTVSEENRLFSIKVSQLISSDNLKAPSGCLQYYKNEHGYIESFNYRDTSEIGITRISSYLNYLNYAICIERAHAFCSVTYTNVGDMQIINYDSEGLPVIPPRQAGVEIFDCPSDWLLIAAVRLCGERLNDGSILQDFTLDAPVTDDGAGPIVIWFRTDGIYAGRGFKLSYQQNACTK
ncbi:uncharacterized protein LOC124543928 isoform X1 [Vanessa cardui]|uniref:uncharacterized protein LOC124543928 isoform X1 n=1 Tax=Vanessa cardui TaxID=171605 RepID=UPI001F147AD4|nr:uncharacterized protein LOC124543928 isoform X1 [Vanessa cardui]